MLLSWTAEREARGGKAFLRKAGRAKVSLKCKGQFRHGKQSLSFFSRFFPCVSNTKPAGALKLKKSDLEFSLL